MDNICLATTTTSNSTALYDMEDRFLVQHRLLSKWQSQLEYFLYHFCRINAPQLLGECRWSCPEAAELTRLSEKITEYYCFHRKSAFQSRGISEQERESFCTKLQQVRQIRNFAVHRVMLKADTIRRYAKITIDVLVFTQRLGNSEYQALFTGPLNRFIETFWEASDSYQPEMIFQNYQATETSKTSEENFSNMEKRESNLNTTIEAQQIAAQRKASNVKKMIEAFENSKKSKMSRQDRAEREKEVAQLRMAERAERRRKQEEDAAVRRAQRAEKAEIQGEKPKVKL